MRILIVGDDFRLLATRAAVLAKTGASTVCCTASEMMRDLAREHFDLVVLCHSLSDRDAREVTIVAGRWWPQARVLSILSTMEAANYSGEGSDALLPSDPNGLVRQVATLLQKLQNHHIRETVPVLGATASGLKVERRMMA